MKLLIVPSWYPTNIHPESGTFFRDRAIILQKCGFSITIASHVLHSTRDILRFKQNVSNIETINDGGVLVYKTEAINAFPKMPRKAFNSYKNSILSLVKNVINKFQGCSRIVVNDDAFLVLSGMGRDFTNLNLFCRCSSAGRASDL